MTNQIIKNEGPVGHVAVNSLEWELAWKHLKQVTGAGVIGDRHDPRHHPLNTNRQTLTLDRINEHKFNKETVLVPVSLERVRLVPSTILLRFDFVVINLSELSTTVRTSDYPDTSTWAGMKNTPDYEARVWKDLIWATPNHGLTLSSKVGQGAILVDKVPMQTVSLHIRKPEEMVDALKCVPYGATIHPIIRTVNTASLGSDSLYLHFGWTPAAVADTSDGFKLFPHNKPGRGGVYWCLMSNNKIRQLHWNDVDRKWVNTMGYNISEMVCMFKEAVCPYSVEQLVASYEAQIKEADKEARKAKLVEKLGVLRIQQEALEKQLKQLG
ncbi:hypothetical protein [Delftia phage PhiW-14]|uniref:Uncharacterized protein n=1 Tax=Delftia phage PhiW-14 TaxID=665032 RepID=C9DGD7_BPW14|nr:hypothetical protein DP-phiW-14_gp167 [Delftia phage PhiW-14]ACV50188.1 hypothetical protein [Delftia phage PhiW-14]